MKLFNYFPFFIILISLFVFTIIPQNKIDNKIDQNTKKNDFITSVKLSLNKAQLKPSNLVLKKYENELEFNIDSSKVVFSTQKDPSWQVSSLQEILKTAKIKNKPIKFINLSIQHPYATFQNN